MRPRAIYPAVGGTLAGHFGRWPGSYWQPRPPAAARSAPSLVSGHPPFVGRNGSENSKSVGHPGAADSVGCTWEGNGQTILILVRNNTGGLPIQVKQVTFTPT